MTPDATFGSGDLLSPAKSARPAFYSSLTTYSTLIDQLLHNTNDPNPFRIDELFTRRREDTTLIRQTMPQFDKNGMPSSGRNKLLDSLKCLLDEYKFVNRKSDSKLHRGSWLNSLYSKSVSTELDKDCLFFGDFFFGFFFFVLVFCFFAFSRLRVQICERRKNCCVFTIQEFGLYLLS